MTRVLFRITLWLVIIVLLPTLARAEGYLLANIGGRGRVVSREEVRSMYLNHKPKWPSGLRVKLAILADGKAREDFLRLYVGKNSARFTRYWRRQLFTGRGVPPVEFASQDEMVNFLRNTPGAIGFVEMAQPPAGLSVLGVHGKAQAEKEGGSSR